MPESLEEQLKHWTLLAAQQNAQSMYVYQRADGSHYPLVVFVNSNPINPENNPVKVMGGKFT